MKRTIIAAALALASFAAAADPICDQVSTIARNVMEARQLGVDITKLLQVADPKNFYGKIARSLIVDAYARPRFQTPEMQRRSIDDFGNEHALICIRAIGAS